MPRPARLHVSTTEWRSPLPGLLARLALSTAVVAAALYSLEPLLYAALGRIARDLVVFSTTAPRIEQLGWVGDQFAVRSPLYRGVMGVTAPWFAIAVGVPLALATSMPGAFSAAGARRCGGIIGTALAVGGVALANDVLAGLVLTLGRRGVAVLPPWHAAIHTRAREGLWELAMVLLPAALCLASALSLLPWHSPKGAVRPGHGRRRVLALGLGLVAFMWIDRAASARLQRFDPGALLADLEPYNPDLGAFLLRVGEEELAAGHPDAALESFRLALRYPRYALDADAALERLRSAPQ